MSRSTAEVFSSFGVEEEVLAHHGVLGMKWGKHKARKASSSSESSSSNKTDSEDSSSHESSGRSSKRRSTSEDYQHVKSLKKQKASELSNKELKDAIARMNLEKQYKDLNPKGLSKAQKQILMALAVGATANKVLEFSQSKAGQKIKDQVLKNVKKAV